MDERSTSRDGMNDRPRPVQPARAENAFMVEHCDVPAEMTLLEWRRHCAAERRADDMRAAESRRGVLRRMLRRAA
jgi:hypothetical protein